MSVVDVTGLGKSFGARTAVRDISLQVERGRVIGFLGPNGCGKTTTFRMLCGLIKPDSGTGTCAGYDILSESGEARSRIGYMTQRFTLYEDLSVEENLMFFARLYGTQGRRRKVLDLEERFDLLDRKDQTAGTLSGGWRQRLALAASILHEPELLLLDEPTAGVDPEARREFWTEIHRLARDGLTVLVSTHYMDEASLCDEVRFLLDGEIVVSGPSDSIVTGAGLKVLTMSVPSTLDVAAYFREIPGALLYSVSGNSLRVILSSSDPDSPGSQAQLLRDFNAHAAALTLDDVFVHLAGKRQTR